MGYKQFSYILIVYSYNYVIFITIFSVAGSIFLPKLKYLFSVFYAKKRSDAPALLLFFIELLIFLHCMLLPVPSSLRWCNRLRWFPSSSSCRSGSRIPHSSCCMD